MSGLEEADFLQISRQFLRTVRGRRSQVALSRRLGFASNVAAEWESGRRVPFLSAVLTCCTRCGIDVASGFGRFWPPARELLGELDPRAVARWLDSQRGEETFSAVARRAGLSRHQTTRILSGETEPRLHHFFALVEGITARLSDLLAEVVDIEQIEALREHHERVVLSRRLAYEEPWTSALLSGLECVAALPRKQAEQRLAEAFRLPLDRVRGYLQSLVQARLIARRRHRYVLRDPLVVDTGSRRSRPFVSRLTGRKSPPSGQGIPTRATCTATMCFPSPAKTSNGSRRCSGSIFRKSAPSSPSRPPRRWRS